MKILCLILALLPLLASAEVYKWTDENGNVHFGDRPKNLNKAEVVEIREQKTGSMVSDSQKAAYKYDARVQSVSTTPSYKAPDPQSGRSCQLAKSFLAEAELKLTQLKRRGYKQYERASAEDDVETWKQRTQTYCQ